MRATHLMPRFLEAGLLRVLGAVGTPAGAGATTITFNTSDTRQAMAKFLFVGLVLTNLLLLSNPVQATPLTLNGLTFIGTSFTGTAPDSAAAGDDVSLVSSHVTATGSATLNGGDNVNLDAASTLTADTSILINLDFGNADAGVGGIFTFTGGLTAPLILVTGGPDSDTINFLGLSGIVLFDSGDPLSGTLTFGSSVLSFHNIEHITGNVTEASSAVPEPTSLLLLGTGLIGAGVRRYRRK